MFPRIRFLLACFGLGVVVAAHGQAVATSGSGSASPAAARTPDPVQVANHAASVADRKRLLGLLGIADALAAPPAEAVHRPGTPYNYDEAKANPYPIPDPLVLHNGSRVEDAKMWWLLRRPEIASDFATYVYGRIPKETPKVRWEVVSVTKLASVAMVSGSTVVVRTVQRVPVRVPGLTGTSTLPTPSAEELKRIVEKDGGVLTGTTDILKLGAGDAQVSGSASGETNVAGGMRRRVVIGSEGAVSGTGGVVARGNNDSRANGNAGPVERNRDVNIGAGSDAGGYKGALVLKTIRGTVDNSSYPAASAHIDVKLYLPADAKGPVPVICEIVPGGSGRFGRLPPVALGRILAKGWGCATVSTYPLQADSGAGLTDGVIGIVNKGKPRELDQWGALAAWSWGLSRVIDYLETDPAVDAKRLGLEGHSRWGKTAMLAAALEPRWAVTYISCSGQGGVQPVRRNFGEPVDNVASDGEYHWMAGNYLKYACNWNAMPEDAPALLAMIAPRPVFIGCGTTDPWSDAHGEWLTVAAAGPVWTLLGKDDVGTTVQPAADAEWISGDIGYRMHTGGHTDALDFPTFLKFAQKYFGAGK